jgi:hypothetical protein
MSIAEFARRIDGFELQEIARADGRHEAIHVIGAVDDDNFLNSLRNYVGECARLRDEQRRPAPGVIPPTESDGQPYDPSNAKDGRESVMRAIKERRGQAGFRTALLEAYDRCCAITRCTVLDVLEAAHVTPYLGPETNNVTNGILLRADLHTLFDLHMIAVDPENMRVSVHPKLKQSEYGKYDGTKISTPSSPTARPSKKALHKHLIGCNFAG